MRKYIVIAILLLVVIVQLFPVKKTNPPVIAEIKATNDIKEIFKESCYDCHSNSTTWPWYSFVAPASWIISHHVIEGREYLNFSIWENLDNKVKDHMKREIISEMQRNKMPLPVYTLLHKNAKIDSVKMDIIIQWSNTAQ